MWQDQQVWLHGDANPANFLFGHGMDVAAIDLERMKRGDRMFDVGRVAGELLHAFMSSVGGRHRAKPFIRHFLREYSRHFPDPQQTYESITERASYYMALNLLRIARNDYIAEGLRRTTRGPGEEVASSRLNPRIRWPSRRTGRTVRDDANQTSLGAGAGSSPSRQLRDP
jgi:aminoglycoside phosphotransferase (APT) family kinase protein